MTKNEAMTMVKLTSSGTIAHIIGSPKYAAIDAAYCDWILAVAAASEEAFRDCQTLQDVLDVIK